MHSVEHAVHVDATRDMPHEECVHTHTLPVRVSQDGEVFYQETLFCKN